MLQPLTDREKEVLRLRYGLGTDRENTLEEIGRCPSVTRECVRQIEARALGKLRDKGRAASNFASALQFDLDDPHRRGWPGFPTWCVARVAEADAAALELDAPVLPAGSVKTSAPGVRITPTCAHRGACMPVSSTPAEMLRRARAPDRSRARSLRSTSPHPPELGPSAPSTGAGGQRDAGQESNHENRAVPMMSDVQGRPQCFQSTVGDYHALMPSAPSALRLMPRRCPVFLPLARRGGRPRDLGGTRETRERYALHVAHVRQRP